jgi:hypothetical protein
MSLTFWLILFWNFLKLYNSCPSIRGVVHLSKLYSSMLQFGVRVLLLFVGPLFVTFCNMQALTRLFNLLSIVLCDIVIFILTLFLFVLFLAPAYDIVVNSCVCSVLSSVFIYYEAEGRGGWERCILLLCVNFVPYFEYRFMCINMCVVNV